MEHNIIFDNIVEDMISGYRVQGGEVADPPEWELDDIDPNDYSDNVEWGI